MTITKENKATRVACDRGLFKIGNFDNQIYIANGYGDGIHYVQVKEKANTEVEDDFRYIGEVDLKDSYVFENDIEGNFEVARDLEKFEKVTLNGSYEIYTALENNKSYLMLLKK